MKEICFHGSYRCSDDSGNLVVRQIVIDTKDQRGSLFLWQTRNRCPHRRCALASQDPGVGAFFSKVGVIGGVKCRPLVATRAHPVQTNIDGNAIQPRAERGLALETMQASICADEDVLREIARVLVIAGEAITQLVDLPLVPFDDRIKCVATSAEARLYERAVVRAVGQRLSVSPRCLSAAVSGHGHPPVPRPQSRPGPIECAVGAHLSFRLLKDAQSKEGHLIR